VGTAKHAVDWGSTFTGESKRTSLISTLSTRSAEPSSRGATADAGARYGTFAGVLAYDLLWVNTIPPYAGTLDVLDVLAVEAKTRGSSSRTGDWRRSQAELRVLKITYVVRRDRRLSGVTAASPGDEVELSRRSIHGAAQ